MHHAILLQRVVAAGGAAVTCTHCRLEQYRVVIGLGGPQLRDPLSAPPTAESSDTATLFPRLHPLQDQSLQVVLIKHTAAGTIRGMPRALASRATTGRQSMAQRRHDVQLSTDRTGSRRAEPYERLRQKTARMEPPCVNNHS